MKINRSIFNDLSSEMSKPEVLILLGARQVGKSTLMEGLELLAKKEQRAFKSFNLELPNDLLYFSKSEAEIFDSLTEVSNSIIFIDEFHYLKNASKIFKAIFDSKKGIKIVVSGSSSLEIHKHLKESLAGRRKIFRIYPLTWSERSQTTGSFNDYVVYGGMPGLVHLGETEEKIEYLAQLIQAYILKDIRGLIKEENVRAFNHILFFLAENQGQVISTSSLAREVKMTSKTIENYLEILEQTFVVYGLHSYSNKLSNELKKSRKYYFYDNGIRNSLVKDFKKIGKRDDAGFLYEACVFLELHKRLKANIELRFWRTKQGDEVDFIWLKDRLPIPIEVKTTFTEGKLPKGLLKFLRNYPKSPYGVILNSKESKDLEFEGRLIKVRRFEGIQELLDDM